MHNWNLCFLFVLAASLAVGCSGTSSSPTSPSAAVSGGTALTTEALAGTWALVSLQPANESAQPAPAGVTYALTFSNDRISTRADCNTCSATFALSGQTLTVGPALACTRAACSTMAFENRYTSVLSGESTVSMAGSTLVLSSARGTLRFTR